MPRLLKRSEASMERGVDIHTSRATIHTVKELSNGQIF